jgi:Family of unknown function (DUF6152)
VRTSKGWRIPVALVSLTALCLTSGTLLAHHSFAMFDTTKNVTLSGTVTAFEWTNPHAYIEVDVAEPGGGVKHWSVEMGSPSILQQSGWKFKDVKPGDKITFSLSPLRNGDPGGLLVQATLADGRVLGNGPGRGPAAPAAGRGPAAPAAGRGPAAPAAGRGPAAPTAAPAPAGR